MCKYRLHMDCDNRVSNVWFSLTSPRPSYKVPICPVSGKNDALQSHCDLYITDCLRLARFYWAYYVIYPYM